MDIGPSPWRRDRHGPRPFPVGEGTEALVRAVRRLADQGLSASVEYHGEEVRHPEQVSAALHRYLRLLDRLAAEGLSAVTELSVHPTELGLYLGAEGEALAVASLARLCAGAERTGATVTVRAGTGGTDEAVSRLVAAVRTDHPRLGVEVWPRSRLTGEPPLRPGSRVRLCSGAPEGAPAATLLSRHEGDLAYVRALRRLIDSGAQLVVATHDPRLMAIAGALAALATEEIEYQVGRGARPRDIGEPGARVRVGLAYGPGHRGSPRRGPRPVSTPGGPPSARLGPGPLTWDPVER
ncbi:L-proline dehydrogenase [Marinactinospora thermotolerans DSM 45154]|uniref:L-proline dehydrogenase n=1 Tax=Marinactinospora thermotolerans DSM 45154 TaxID=1122192 RepID=A0A1T4SSK6_9ACTN|nr:hypothetical protein [Marinactinospora thermotolerans]SKA31225.1 L-proline dehydrogenase [Marinactinospora thermotolerans DSM 45154]